MVTRVRTIDAPGVDISVSGLNRILVYTHNAIGQGHAVRTMAVIDGMRAVLPETDFLVVTGGSTPDVFLAEGVETVKLPSLRQDVDAPGHPFRPRYLRGLDREALTAWRARLVADCLEAFNPQAVMVEHSLAGLLGEAAPLLAGSRRARPGGHLMVHLSRGIFRSAPMLLAPPANYPGLAPGLAATALYDAFFVLEDRAVVDVNREFFGADPEIEPRMRYLGRVAAQNPEELPPPGHVRAEIGAGRPLVLASLGRHGPVEDLHAALFRALDRLKSFQGGTALVVLDRHLAPERAERIKALPCPAGTRFTRSPPSLTAVMAVADLVACRAGYNTINELLVTGAPALVVPESHPSREQERRAALLPREGFRVLEGCEGFESAAAELLGTARRVERARFDRFRVGRRIVRRMARLLSAP